MKLGLSLAAISALAAACGDVPSARLRLDFADPEVESRTKAVEVVVREVKEMRNGCDFLWSTSPPPGNPGETRSTVLYPSRVDALATPVALELYKNLTFLVYAFPSADDVSPAKRIAGGCAQVAIDGASTQDVVIELKKP